ncbi:MAG: PKD domain-containing protein, partial [Planctomycetes bacterium]|nr:PKD domain-containing protein [Planctomycetota bacterium]
NDGVAVDRIILTREPTLLFAPWRPAPNFGGGNACSSEGTDSDEGGDPIGGTGGQLVELANEDFESGWGNWTDGGGDCSRYTASPPPTTIYDDFESGWGNWTDGGGDCSRYTGPRACNGSAINIQDNSGGASSFRLTNDLDLDTSRCTDLTIEFCFYAYSMENGEDFWLQYSSNSGGTWQTIADYDRGPDFNNGVFYNETVTISESNYNFTANARIRFRCDASGNADDIYIDQVRISGIGCSTVSNVCEGNSAIDIRDNSGAGSSTSLSNDLDLDTPGYTDLTIEFCYNAESMESGEDFLLEYSPNSGGAWQPITSYVSGVDFNNGNFNSESVIISESNYNFTSTARIRFRCDASNNEDHIYIGQVRITSTNPVSNPTNTTPHANAGGPYNCGQVPAEVRFINLSHDDDGDNLSFLWDFGDGDTSTARDPVHTYRTDSTYNVTLTVTDDGSPVGETIANTTVGIGAGGNCGGFTHSSPQPPMLATLIQQDFFVPDSAQDNRIIIEAEWYHHGIARNNIQWKEDNDNYFPDFSGVSYVQALPDNGVNNNTGYANSSPELIYYVYFDAIGTWYLGAEGYREGTGGDSFHAGIDYSTPSSSDRINVYNNWAYANDTMDGSPAQFDVPNVGVHTLHIWMREDGVRLDRFFLSQDPSIPDFAGSGPLIETVNYPRLNWEETTDALGNSESLQVDEPYDDEFFLFQKDYPPGTVRLGGNDLDCSKSIYLAFVVPKNQKGQVNISNLRLDNPQECETFADLFQRNLWSIRNKNQFATGDSMYIDRNYLWGDDIDFMT